MPCCKAKGWIKEVRDIRRRISGWCEDEDVLYTDEDGKDFCLFHAPADKKGMSVEEFNELVFERIRQTPKEKRCNFDGTIFPGNISFSTFDKDHPLPSYISFSDAAFIGYASFYKGVFGGAADFSDAAFSEKADFREVTFNGDAYFVGAVFSVAAQFAQATISGAATFNKVMFSEEADFFRATFGGDADFKAVMFSGSPYFDGATFRGDASFNNATMEGDALFRNAEFRGDASFSKTVINGHIDFSGSVFNPKERVRFAGTCFKGNANFEWTVFDGLVLFDQAGEFDKKSTVTVFLGKVSFCRSTFSGSTEFLGVTFSDTARFAFCSVEKRLRFENVDLANVSFLDAEVAKGEFVNCKWPRMKAHFLNRFFPKKDGSDWGRYRVMEEKQEDPPWAKIETLYRRLKQKAKEEHNEPEVSEWHYSEKEMARKQGGIRWPVLFLYWLSSGYGERPLRAAGVLLGLLAAVALLMGWFGLNPAESGSAIQAIQHLSGLNFDQIVLLIENTIQNVLFIKNARMMPLEPVPWEFVQTIFTRILIPIQFALFAFALRNKFRR